MFQKILSFTLFFIFIQVSAHSQSTPWISPIQGQVLLSGTFGELRGSHFHGGIDIKPNIGGHQPILAVADGYIQTIKINGGSYGNGLIVAHKNGMKSLYGHMNHFEEKIDSVARSIQQRDTSFAINVELDSTVLPVSQGDVIGYMGNTGYSFGQHLHFEAHNREGDIINPQHLIPALKDDKSPFFKNLRINYLDANGREYKDKTLRINNPSPGKYANTNITVNAFQISLAIEVIDLHNLTHNKNGIYSLEMYVNDSLYFATAFDSLTATQRKYYPSQIDYLTNEERSTPLLLLKEYTEIDQMIKLNPHRPKNIKMIATDFQGNTSTYTCDIHQQDPVKIDYQKIYNYLIEPGKNNKIKLDLYEIIFPKNTFTHPSKLYVFEEMNITDNEEQWLLHLDKDKMPLYRDFVISFKDNRSLEEKAKWTLAQYKGNSIRPLIHTVRKKDSFIAQASSLGDFTLVQDTIPPTIEKFHATSNRWTFTLKDNLFPFSSLTYYAKIDDEWTLMREVYKSNQLILEGINKLVDGQQHLFTLRVIDNCGNELYFEKSIQ
ncbi:M23 family metallopeptidase [Membranihabitans marinus]|uniref:M23 family metallopeptidase n=1 Tax=Membranihabitans marinus TaxID=1227546 RepID=UPI001F1A90F6|nr:M23 family metallopeptidase [Membranihabitans marinus]